jgi:hypothetical protein
MDEMRYSSSARESRKHEAGCPQILQVWRALETAVRAITSSLSNTLINSFTRFMVHLHDAYMGCFQSAIPDPKPYADFHMSRDALLKACLLYLPALARQSMPPQFQRLSSALSLPFR